MRHLARRRDRHEHEDGWVERSEGAHEAPRKDAEAVPTWRDKTPARVGRLAKPMLRVGLETARLGQLTYQALRSAAAEARAEVQDGQPAEVVRSPPPRADGRHVAVRTTTFEYRPSARRPARPSAAMLLDLLAAALIPILVCAGAAFAFASQQDKVYAARAEIVFDLRRLAWSSADRFLESQIVVAGSHTLLASVATFYGLPLARLEEDLEVHEVDNSGVIRIQYPHPDPQLALAVTQGVLDRYLVQLRQFEQREGGSHRLLTPPFVLEEPVAPKPLRAAALGAVAGMLLAGLALFLRMRAWRAA